VSRTKSPDSADFSGHDEGAPDPTDGLTPRQAKALSALLQEPTLARAAAVAGCGERSLRRWLTEAPFRDAVYRARREAFGQAIWLTQRYAAVAVATLVQVMQDKTSPPGSKVSAAGMLLKFGREALELDDLAERVETLERQAGGNGAMVKVKRNGRDGAEEQDREDET
jgi:hypothetical protein